MYFALGLFAITYALLLAFGSLEHILLLFRPCYL